MLTIILTSIFLSLLLCIITSLTKPLKYVYKFINTNVEKTLNYNQIPGPVSYPLIGNVLGYKCPEQGRYVNYDMKSVIV